MQSVAVRTNCWMATFFCCTDNWVVPVGATFGPVATPITSAAPVSGARIILLSPTLIRDELKQNQIGRNEKSRHCCGTGNFPPGMCSLAHGLTGTVDNIG